MAILYSRGIAAFIVMVLIKSFSTTTHLVSSARAKAGNFRCSYRLGTRVDIPSINSVNMMSLPENYSKEYYIRHINSWPTLCVVAENANEKIIGYALGRVVAADDDLASGFHGHVASIAVLEGFRGQGNLLIIKSLTAHVCSMFVMCS